MAEMEIGKLRLAFSGLSPAQPRRIAELVADALSRAALPAAARELGAISIDVTARAGEDDVALAERIAARILSQLEAAS
jgi:hypothetical protein